jgi:hypothetical protein
MPGLGGYSAESPPRHLAVKRATRGLAGRASRIGNDMWGFMTLTLALTRASNREQVCPRNPVQCRYREGRGIRERKAWVLQQPGGAPGRTVK